MAAFEQARTHLESLIGPDNINLESFYEAIDDALEVHFARVAGATPPNVIQRLMPSRALERLHYEIKRVIQIHCAVTDRDKTGYVQRLLPRLARFAPYPVSSFNYDSVVETACAATGLTFGERVLGEDVTRKDIELVKVHGSVTWLAGRDGGLHRAPTFTGSAISALGEVRSAVLETPMIYPSRRKMPLQGPFMANALRLRELFASRRTCIAIGYSFPDAHVRTWLYDALQQNPEMTLYLIDKFPGRALRNLVTNLPTIDWSRRLQVIEKGFQQAIDDGFEANFGARPFGPDFARHFETKTWSGSRIVCFSRPASGVAASPDGSDLFVSSADSVHRIDLTGASPAEPVLHAGKMRDPRGLAVSKAGEVYVVENRLLTWKRTPRGAGRVLRLSANGEKRVYLSRPSLREARDLLLAIRGGVRSTDLWSKLPSILRWPTDVTVTADGTVFATEARALVKLPAEGGEPDRCYEGELLFNLNGVAAADDGALVAVEQGIGQAASWGRAHRFLVDGDRVTSQLAPSVDGMPRLMGVCFVPGLRKVVLARCLSWPLGGLIVLDYPTLDKAGVLTGFNLPSALAHVPGRGELAVQTADGVCLIPVQALNEAEPIPPLQ